MYLINIEDKWKKKYINKFPYKPIPLDNKKKDNTTYIKTLVYLNISTFFKLFTSIFFVSTTSTLHIDVLCEWYEILECLF